MKILLADDDPRNRERIARVLRNAGNEVTEVIRQLEQKVAEVESAYAALQERETRLRAIIDTEPECVQLLARDGSLLDMNAAGLRMIEADEVSQVQYQCVYPLVAPEHRRQFEELTQRVFGGEQGTLEFEIIGLKGGRRWMESHASPLRDERGEISALLAVTHDVTERKRASEAVAESERRHRLMFAACPLPMWMYDRQSLRYLDANPAAIRHYGYSREEFLQMTLRDIRPAEDVPRLEQSLAQHPAGLHYAGTWRHRRKDGTLVDVDIHADSVELGGRRIELVLAVDVTQRCAAESALHELSARLLGLQDEERRRIARELHDTTAQNLAALSMNLSLLQHGMSGRDAKAARLLEDCARLTDKCHQEIRTLSYLLHPPMLDALGLPGALREYIDGFARRSGIAVQFQTPEDFGRLSAAIETALFRVVQEALGNIHRHSGSSTAEVRLVRKGQRVLLEINDSGRGIAPEKLRQFEGGLAGLGVGLAGMRERMHQLGGDLDVVSDSAGTRVRATLPEPATEAGKR
jgi:PAS domain S-box-containing protein